MEPYIPVEFPYRVGYTAYIFLCGCGAGTHVPSKFSAEKKALLSQARIHQHYRKNPKCVVNSKVEFQRFQNLSGAIAYSTD